MMESSAIQRTSPRKRKRTLLSRNHRHTGIFVLTTAWIVSSVVPLHAFHPPKRSVVRHPKQTSTKSSSSATNTHNNTQDGDDDHSLTSSAKRTNYLHKTTNRLLSLRNLGISKMRGGGDESSSSSTDSSSDHDLQERNRRRGMTAALGLANFSVMGAKCALPSVLSLLLDPTKGLVFSATTQTPQARFAGLLGMSTLSVALGKLLLGPVIDAFGGIRALQFTLALLTVLLATISFSKTFGVFCVCWILVDFVFSSCWAACISSIQQSFPQDEWGSQIGHLATGARLGNAVSFSLFAAILYALEGCWKQPWRVVFGVSTLLQLVPLGLLVHYGGKTLQAKANTTFQTTITNLEKKPRRTLQFSDSLAILQTEAKTPEFWLHLVSRSCLMVFASFLLFVPTLMNQVYGCSNAVAAQVAAAYSLGCLFAVSLGSRLYSKLTRTRFKIGSMASLLTLATGASALQLASVGGLIKLPFSIATASMVLWGFAFSLPFYLPPSLYALKRGGREGSASIADCFDFVGFGFLAWFNRFVASIPDLSNPSSWVGCFGITTACALVAMVAQSTAIGLEAKPTRSSQRPRTMTISKTE